MKKIKLTRGAYTIVGDADYEKINKFKWFYTGKYAVRWKRLSKDMRKMWYMQWDIVGNPPKGFETDHINGNKIDNRRNNLRIVTHSQNQINRKMPQNNTSGFKGVCWDKIKQKWRADIKLNYKRIFLGNFKNKSEAARAYNKMAEKLYGKLAYLNATGSPQEY